MSLFWTAFSNVRVFVENDERNLCVWTWTIASENASKSVRFQKKSISVDGVLPNIGKNVDYNYF